MRFLRRMLDRLDLETYCLRLHVWCGLTGGHRYKETAITDGTLYACRKCCHWFREVRP